MPFVNIKILRGHSQERKDEMSRRISETIHEVAQLPPGAEVWVVWEDVTDENWFVEGKSVKAIRSATG
jgi:4-oxalocrotonate tautomerase